MTVNARIESGRYIVSGLLREPLQIWFQILKCILKWSAITPYGSKIVESFLKVDAFAYQKYLKRYTKKKSNLSRKKKAFEKKRRFSLKGTTSQNTLILWYALWYNYLYVFYHCNKTICHWMINTWHQYQMFHI